jgi:hypothetical protein
MEIAELPLLDESAYYEDNIFELGVNKLSRCFVCDILFEPDKVFRSKYSSRVDVVRWKMDALEMSADMVLFVNGEILYSPQHLFEQARKTSELLKVTLL